ncbi:molecular chaperone, partial [Leptospira borgpetersenii serovar Ballum]|nr:molecular chaperone [Leptospira borgpetersenii serovar Ballum]
PEALAPQRIAIGQPREQDDERVIEGERPALSHSETENQ